MLHRVGKLDEVACIRVNLGVAVTTSSLLPFHDAEMEATHVLQPTEPVRIFEVDMVLVTENGFWAAVRRWPSWDPGHNDGLVDSVQKERQRLATSLLVDTAHVWTRRAQPRVSLGIDVHNSILVDLVAKLGRQVEETRKARVLVRLCEDFNQLKYGPFTIVSGFDPEEQYLAMAKLTYILATAFPDMMRLSTMALRNSFLVQLRYLDMVSP